MFVSKVAVIAAVAGVANVVNAQLTVSSPPSLVECQPTQINFQGGTSPYYLSIIPAGDTSAAALENLPNADASPVTWNVDLKAGTNITIKITDGSGQSQYSSPLAIQKGQDESCLNGGGGGGSSGSASASGGGGGSSASATPSGSGSPSGSPSGSGSASSAASTSGAALPGTPLSGGALVTILGVVAAAFGVTL